MADKQVLTDNLIKVQERIVAAAHRAGRDPSEILLVAVSKGVDAEKILHAIEAGVTDLGENYLQEALEKQAQVEAAVKWHFIGHLQRNKVKAAINSFDLIQSVDSLRLATEIDKRAGEQNKVMDILLEVNTSSEETKFGLEPAEVMQTVEAVAAMQHIKLKGLMTIGRFDPDVEAAREEFKLLAKLFRQLKESRIENIEMTWLSMGMTHDFDTAIEEGSNLVRVGRGIFGERK